MNCNLGASKFSFFNIEWIGNLRVLTVAIDFWRRTLAYAILSVITIIVINVLFQDSAHAQSQLRDIAVSWDDGHGTINSMSGGTYTNQTGEVVIPMGDHLDAEAFEYLGSRRLNLHFYNPQIR